MDKQHFSEIDREIYADGYQLAMDIPVINNCPVNLFDSVQKIYNLLDEVIDSLMNLAGKYGTTADCHKGCSFCCYQPVFAVTHEFEFLADYISKHFTETEKEVILQKAIRKDKIVRDLPRERMLGHRMPCPLLKDDQCSVYEARPMACRIYLSTDVSTCREDYEHPENKDNYPALLDFPLRAGQMLDEGFVAGLKTLGIKSQEMRMEEGLIKHLSLEK
jgi:Fe-S-cluster containining protein